MFTNGRSTAVITTRSGQRAAKWLRLFGVEALPVKHERPRWIAQPGGDMLAYDLDASRLNEWQRARFAGYIAKRQDVPLKVALTMVDNWPIEAAGCQSVASEVDLSARREGERLLTPLPPHMLPQFSANFAPG